jgi:hypothetical protein
MGEQTFFVFNVCRNRVLLIEDLGVRVEIRPYQSVNLLGSGYRIPLEAIRKSYESGSLFKQRNLLIYQKFGGTPVSSTPLTVAEKTLPARWKGPKPERIRSPLEEDLGSEEDIEEDI